MSRISAWSNVCWAIVLLATGCVSIAQQPPADSSTGSGPAGSAVSLAPYDLDAIPDLPTLLWRHQHFQTAALLGGGGAGPLRHQVILVNSNDLVGLGNRVPAMVTGFLMALFSRRLFLLHSTFLEHVDLPFPARWLDHSHRFAGRPNCNAHWAKLGDPGLTWCEDAAPSAPGGSWTGEDGGRGGGGGGNGSTQQTADVVRYSSIDYDAPLLQVNPALMPYFDKFFPDGEVFSALLRHLLRPRASVQAAMQPYLPLASSCVVGMHIRTRKYAGVRVKQFTRIARMLGRGQPGTVFVASDADLFPYVQAGLPGRTVWWSNHTRSALQAATKTKGANPGSELSAVLDVLLLARCKHLVLTPASSLGSLAAGLAGVPPVFANFGRHEDPFLNPWFWRSLTMEPCMFKASTWHAGNDSLVAAFRDAHPLFLYHNQCHYQSHLRRVPQYLKLSTANTSYLPSLVE